MLPPPTGRFSRRFWPLFGLGLLGVATLPISALPAIRGLALPPGAPSPAVLVAAGLAQTAVLLAGFVALGAALAHRLGLRSHVAARAETGVPLRPALRADLGPALLAGAFAALAALALDLALRPLIADGALPEQPRTLGLTVMGVLYGGITEELMTRWGLVSLFAWAGTRLLRQREGPSAGVLWTAVVLAAVLFGVGHLPVLAAQLGASPGMALVIRTIGLNAVLGVIFGGLYVQRSLEAAMIAHGTFHLVLTALAWTGLLAALAR